MLSKRQMIIIAKKSNNTMIGKKGGNMVKPTNETYDKMPKPIIKSQMEK